VLDQPKATNLKANIKSIETKAPKLKKTPASELTLYALLKINEKREIKNGITTTKVKK
jgi:hypothetical protein